MKQTGWVVCWSRLAFACCFWDHHLGAEIAIPPGEDPNSFMTRLHQACDLSCRLNEKGNLEEVICGAICSLDDWL